MQEKTRREEIKAAKRRSRRRRELRQRRNQSGLPRWFIYVTYAMAFFFCLVASTMIILYGIVFEPAVARAWLFSSMLAAFMEVFVNQPAQIAALVTLKEKVVGEMKAFKDRQKKAKELHQDKETITSKKSRFALQMKTKFNLRGK